MKRSAAPSQRSFVPPKPASPGAFQAVIPSIVSVRPPAALGSVAAVPSLNPAVNALLPTRQPIPAIPVTATPPAPAKKTFSIPQPRVLVATPRPAAAASAPAVVADSPSLPDTPCARYYTIMYTKFSKKKHKVYDDGVLTLTGTMAIIQNMEGTAGVCFLLKTNCELRAWLHLCDSVCPGC